LTQSPERRAARLAAAGLAASLAMAVLAAPAAAEDVAIVLDASNSMWGQIDGVSKIEIARDYVATVTANITAFLARRAHVMPLRLENLDEEFPRFLDWIGATGDFGAACAEIRTRHNASEA